MNRITLTCGLALALIGLAGSAAAQISMRGPLAMTAIPQASRVPVASHAAAESASSTVPAGEPKALSGMLTAQNEARGRLNLSQLSWSADLAAKAAETAKVASGKTCNKTNASRVGQAAGAAIYWAAPLRMFSDGDSAQEISASFLISEWLAGAVDYDRQSGQCRKVGACQSFARLASPEARTVGCARNVCDSQAQVWACHYGQ
jgi:hypothetical protein